MKTFNGFRWFYLVPLFPSLNGAQNRKTKPLKLQKLVSKGFQSRAFCSELIFVPWRELGCFIFCKPIDFIWFTLEANAGLETLGPLWWSRGYQFDLWLRDPGLYSCNLHAFFRKRRYSSPQPLDPCPLPLFPIILDFKPVRVRLYRILFSVIHEQRNQN